MSADATPAATPAAAAPSSPTPAASTPAPATPAAEGAVKPAQPAPTSTTGQQQPGNSASLYVGELDPSVTEAMLFEIFNMVGPVASIRVCRDAVTRRSLGYAYVNYLNAADGERALEHLNYSLIKNRPCRIMWSQRDPALRKTGQGNIFIKNLDDKIDNKALHDTFAAFGNILSCKVATDENGNSRGFAFVHYETGEAADAAIKSVNGMLLNDKKVYVGHHISKKERQSKVEEQRAKFTNIFIKNLEPEFTQKDLEDMFKPFGEIVSAALSVGEDGLSKGFAFVNYTSHEAAKKAVDELNDKELSAGKKLYVGRAQKRAERDEELRRMHEERRLENESKTAGVNLYVKNIDDEWDDERLRSEFDFAGTITSAKVMRDDKAASRGFGFVCFSQPDEATRAVQEMNGKMIGTKPLYVSLAQKKEVRRQALESQMQQRNAQRLQYAAANGLGGPQGYMQAPMYYPPMGPYGGPMMPVRGGVVGYPGAPPMMGARPGRYPASGQPGAPVPMGYMPPGGAAGNYPGMPNYPVRPAGNARPPTAARPNGSPSGAQQGLPRGQIPARPQGDAAAPAAGAAAAPRLTAQALARASPGEQKQMLGEAIYPLIHESQPELAGKITGMLLEMDNAELLHLVESPAALTEKVDEALRVLEDWGKDEDKAAGSEEGEKKEEAAAAEADKPAEAEEKKDEAAAETKKD